MEWKRMPFIFPETGRALNVLINKDKIYFTLNSFFKTLGYTSSYNAHQIKKKDAANVIAASEPVKLISGDHSKVYIIEKNYAIKLLEANSFYKPLARNLAPKALRWIKSVVIPNCEGKRNNDAVDKKYTAPATERIRDLLRTGIDIFSVKNSDLFWIQDATALLKELENAEEVA